MSRTRSSSIQFVRVVLTIALAGCGDGRSIDAESTSVVLVTLDTTRVDHLSSYGYARETSPSLDALSKHAVRYSRAWSTSSWTLPAHASLFTGLYPSRHGAHYADNGAAVLGDVLNIPLARFVRAGQLPEARTTLAELLSASGRRTAAFVAGPWLNRGFGLLQGFEVKDDDVDHFGGRPAETITDRALDWLARLPADEPYFLFLNYFDPHAPYEPRQEHADLPNAQRPFQPDYESLMRGESSLSPIEQEILRDRYDAEIREMDAQLGRLLDAVLAREGNSRTLIIVTSDHGEALGEEGRLGHGFWLSEEIIRIPLVIRFPDERGAGTWSDRRMQLVDILPLVAAELDLILPDEIAAAQLSRGDVAIAELYREATTVVRYGQRYDRHLLVAIDWPYKLERLDQGDERLLRLRDDSLREVPASAPPGVEERLSAALESHVSSAPDYELVQPEVSSDTVEALRQLGYVQ